jgi:hypothetical protein
MAGMKEELFTSKQVAEKLGRSQRAVTKQAEALGVGQKLGPLWVFTAEDVEELRKVDPRGGRPTKNGRMRTYRTPIEKMGSRVPKRYRREDEKPPLPEAS